MRRRSATKKRPSAKKKLAEAEAAAAVKRQAEEAARRQSAVLVTPLNSAPPPPEFTGQTGEAGGENPIKEREGGDASMPDAVMPPPLPPPPSRSGKANSRQIRPCRRLKMRPWQGYSFKSDRQRAAVLRRRLRRHAPWRPAPLARRSQTPKRRAPCPLGGCEEAARAR